MAIGYVLYNKKSGAPEDQENNKLLDMVLDMPVKLIDISKIKDYAVFFRGLAKDDCVIISGGDGTINHFVNDSITIIGYI